MVETIPSTNPGGATTLTSTSSPPPPPSLEPSLPSLPSPEPLPIPTPQETHEEPLNSPTPESRPTTPGLSGVNERHSPPPLQVVPPVLTQCLPPPATTTEPTTDPEQRASEPSSLVDASSHVERLPSAKGALAFNGSSPFITPATIEFWQNVRAGQHWTDMVISFLRFEELPMADGVSPLTPPVPRTLISFQSPLRISTDSRPAEVAKWMKYRDYTTDRIPFVSDVASYRNSWILWWTSCQPAWRRSKGWPLPREDEGTTNWVKVGIRGQNGLFLVVMSTTWWAYSIKSEEEWREFDEAVEDVEWVIGQVAHSLKALQGLIPPTQPAPSKKPKPSASWMVRDTAKRQPKPSRRLLEAGGA
jgi:hypothetical protein